MYQKMIAGKQKITVGALAAMMVFLFAACGPQKLSEAFDEAKVLETTETVVGALNEQDYKALEEMVREEYKDQLNEAVFQDSFGAAMDELGDFDSYIDKSVVGMSSKDFDGDIAVAIVNLQYAHGSQTVTVSFDTNYEIIGFYANYHKEGQQ